ncbi:MAG: hypothetical protein HZA92_11340 [Verrucomicrobia bacterium]|nr:hypothetical protein [Verrucomicrobiota bacterium]
MKQFWFLTFLSAVVVASSACRKRAKNPTPEPGAVAPAAEATAAGEQAAPAPASEPPAAAPASKTAGSVEVNGVTYSFANDPASVIKRANATYSLQIDKFYEKKGRFPTSLAEAGLTQVPLPPGRQASYNPTTGIVTIK